MLTVLEMLPISVFV